MEETYNMHNIEAYLGEIGLSPSEITLYMAGLGLGTCGVAQLVTQTGMKRPTVYYALNELVAKGLTRETKVGKELSYVMVPPSEIGVFIRSKIAELSEKERRLDQFLPLFPREVTSPLASQVHQFTGKDEVRQLIDMALYCQQKRWDIIAPKDNFIAGSDDAYIAYFKRTREAQGIVSQSLWEKKLTGRELNIRDIISRKPRYLPKEYQGKFKSMIILFDKSVALIGSSKSQEGLLIRSRDYYDILSVLFEAMWSKADKP